MARRKPTVSTAAVVRDYIDTHPSIKDGMRMGITQAPRKARPVLDGFLRNPFCTVHPVMGGQRGGR